MLGREAVGHCVSCKRSDLIVGNVKSNHRKEWSRDADLEALGFKLVRECTEEKL